MQFTDIMKSLGYIVHMVQVQEEWDSEERKGYRIQDMRVLSSTSSATFPHLYDWPVLIYSGAPHSDVNLFQD